MRTSQPASPSVRPGSGVSAAWRAIRADLDARGEIRWEFAEDQAEELHYRLMLASERRTRERAYRLAHRIYTRQGYEIPGKGMCLSQFDADPRTVTFLAESPRGEDVGTVSVVFDSAAGLPVDDIYRPEVDQLRQRGGRLCEATRLALEHIPPAHSKLVLLRLFNFATLCCAYRVGGCSHMVIEVNPHHVNYYKRIMDFEQIGPERPCPRVQGAPAVLLRLDLAAVAAYCERIRFAASCARNHLLYNRFYDAETEAAAVEFLKQHHRPLSPEDARYFELQPAAVTV